MDSGGKFLAFWKTWFESWGCLDSFTDFTTMLHEVLQKHQVSALVLEARRVNMSKYYPNKSGKGWEGRQAEKWGDFLRAEHFLFSWEKRRKYTHHSRHLSLVQVPGSFPVISTVHIEGIGTVAWLAFSSAEREREYVLRSPAPVSPCSSIFLCPDNLSVTD